MERLQKVIANSGYCSRRKAEELIINGKVKVNGQLVYELGTKVNENDEIMVDNKIISKENKEYILLYKPRGVVTTTSDDKNRKTVLDLIETTKRIYPIGRLDYDTIVQKIEKAFKKSVIKDYQLTVEPTKSSIRELRLLADKVRDLQISGIKRIGKVIIRKEDEWIIHTEGSNLGDVLEIDGIDKVRTTTNDIHEIEQVLGIEAARKSIINEIKNTLEGQGLSVDDRHIMLVADTMTSEGVVKSIGRHGISGEKSSVLARAAFEETGKHLLNASIRGEVDHLTGIIENIIIGQPIPLGTGSVGVKMANKK